MTLQIDENAFLPIYDDGTGIDKIYVTPECLAELKEITQEQIDKEMIGRMYDVLVSVGGPDLRNVPENERTTFISKFMEENKDKFNNHGK